MFYLYSYDGFIVDFTELKVGYFKYTVPRIDLELMKALCDVITPEADWILSNRKPS